MNMEDNNIEEIKEEAKNAWLAYGESIKEAFGFTGNIEAAPLLRVIQTDDKQTILEFIQQTNELKHRMDEMISRFKN